MRSSSNNSSTVQDIKELRAELQRLSSLVKDTATHARSEGLSNVIGLDGRELRKMARDAGKNARRFISQKQRQAAELRNEAEDRITSHPFQAVGGAVLSGLILGVLFGRRL